MVCVQSFLSPRTEFDNLAKDRLKEDSATQAGAGNRVLNIKGFIVLHGDMNVNKKIAIKGFLLYFVKGRLESLVFSLKNTKEFACRVSLSA